MLREDYISDGWVLILQDGVELTGLESIYDLVTLFPQDPEIFENTIRYNITLGLEYSEVEIREACETVAFQEVVDHHRISSSPLLKKRASIYPVDKNNALHSPEVFWLQKSRHHING